MKELDEIRARLERVTRRLESWDGHDPSRIRATTVEAEDDFGAFTVRNYHGSYISALDAAAEQFLDTTPKLLAAIKAIEALADNAVHNINPHELRAALTAALTPTTAVTSGAGEPRGAGDEYLGVDEKRGAQKGVQGRGA